MNNTLHKQLRAAGAKEHEAAALAQLAKQLRAAQPRGLSPSAKERIYHQLTGDTGTARKRRSFLWGTAGSLAGAMALLLLVTTLTLPTKQPGSTVTDNPVQSQLQPEQTEMQLEELKAEVEALESKPTVDPKKLHDAEHRYQDAFDRFKKQYEGSDRYKNYDWSKWQPSVRDNHRSTDSWPWNGRR